MRLLLTTTKIMQNKVNLLEELNNCKTIGITGHTNPDGDCVGSCLGLRKYLINAMPDAEIRVFLEQPSEVFSYLEGYMAIENDSDMNSKFDAFLCIDGVPERAKEHKDMFFAAGKKINIDHHETNLEKYDVSVVKGDIGSCAEVLFDMFEKEYIDKDVALCLYTGMIHDTGVFQYSNTTPATMRKAADLMEYGFNFPKVIEDSFYKKSYIATQLLGRTLLESIRFLDDRCIVGWLDKKTLDFYNATPKNLDGIVNHLRNVRGISCAVFMYQVGTGQYKISLRSDEKVDVARIATKFGGGGHKRAAGVTMQGTFYDCINNISAEIEAQLKN